MLNPDWQIYYPFLLNADADADADADEIITMIMTNLPLAAKEQKTTQHTNLKAMQNIKKNTKDTLKPNYPKESLCFLPHFEIAICET